MVVRYKAEPTFSRERPEVLFSEAITAESAETRHSPRRQAFPDDEGDGATGEASERQELIVVPGLRSSSSWCQRGDVHPKNVRQNGPSSLDNSHTFLIEILPLI